MASHAELTRDTRESPSVAVRSTRTPFAAISEKLNARPAAVEQRAMAEKLSDARAAIRTGLPARLKAGVEALSGISLDDVRVHRDSGKPAQLQAHAFAQGSEIHLAPGQERHLPHEAWHVIQQKQGRVPATRQLKRGVPVNDDAALEAEADAMGALALGTAPVAQRAPIRLTGGSAAPVQLYSLSTHGNWRYSENDHYITADVAESLVYALPHVAPPTSSTKSGSQNIGGTVYDEYVPAFDVTEDCGTAMEEIMLGRIPDAAALGKKSLAEFVGTGQKFGATNVSNMRNGLATDEGVSASATAGQGLVTIRHNGKAGHPYHAAAVVAKDGPDHVTLETTAPPSGVSSTPAKPVYDMYGPRKTSFHTGYATKAAYGTDATTSVVKLTDKLPPGI